MLAVVHHRDSHQLVEGQVLQEFRRHEEVLTLIGTACDVDQHLEDFAFVFRIHSLIDLVDTVMIN